MAISLRQCLRPAIPIVARSRNLGRGVNLATAAFYTGSDAPLVHIQSDGIHDFHGDLLGVLNLLVPEFSFFAPSTHIQTNQELEASQNDVRPERSGSDWLIIAWPTNPLRKPTFPKGQ